MAVNYLWMFIVHLAMTTTEAYRILGIFPHFGKSHFDVFQPIMQELHERGHDVSVLSYHPVTAAGYKDYVLESELYTGGNVIPFEWLSGGYKSRFIEVFLIHHMAQETCGVNLRAPAVKELLKSRKRFDVILIEAFNTDCYLGLVHRLQAPFIHMSSGPMVPWYFARFGQPDNTAYLGNIFIGLAGEMTFGERVLNTIAHLWQLAIYQYYVLPIDNRHAKTAFGEDLPLLEEIGNNASMHIVGEHFTFQRPRPNVPAVVQIGGVHLNNKIAKKIPKNIEKWINESKEGVIYFSMGSMIKGHTFPEDKRKIFLRAFGRLKQRVLWKWENETMPDKPDNVMIQKWMPQFDILSHPNVRAFISHGGLLGTTEAVHCGVPVVVMPQFGDQHTNARALEAGGGGIVLNFREADEEMVYQALKKVLDPEFNKKAKELSARFRDRPMSPMDTAIYWIEYVARHKGAHHLRTAAVGMPLYQYLLLDVFGFLALCVIAALLVIYFAIKMMLRLVMALFSSGDKKQKKQKKN